MTRSYVKATGWVCLMAVMGLAAAGCLHLELHVRLAPDGTATATERLRFSEQLLDLGSVASAQLDVAPFLTKAAALERLKHMGKGVSLVSHTVKDIEGGAKESVAVFTIQDLNEFQYVSPFLTYTDYAENHVIKCTLEPVYTCRTPRASAGHMSVAFQPLKRPVAEPRPEEGAPPPKGPTPADVQRFRDVQHIFRDMLKDFKVRFTFESYAPIAHTGFGWRGHKARVNFVDLIYFTDQDLDRWGGRFLENEEVMLELIQLDLGGPNITNSVYEFVNNPSVPVFHPWGSRHRRWRQNDQIFFRPSRALFDKYFKGKQLHYRWGPRTTLPAKFESIGWQADHARNPSE